MSLAKKVLASRRNTVTTSFGVIHIRAVNAHEMIVGLGTVPALFDVNEVLKARGNRSQPATDEVKAEQVVKSVRQLQKFSEVLICNGVCGAAEDPAFRIVAKPPHECAENELSIFDLPNEDSQALLRGIKTLSGIKDEEEVGDQPATFRGQCPLPTAPAPQAG